MQRRDLAVDGTIAAVVYGLTVAMLGARGLGTPDPEVRGDDGLSVLLAAAASLPLLARRLAPLSVFAATAAASLVLLSLNYGLDLPFGSVVAAYGMAEAYGGARGTARRWAALLCTTGFLPLSVGAWMIAEATLQPRLVPGFLVWVLLFVGAWIAGDRTQLRRAHIAGLEDRARRMEQEAVRERRMAAAEERIRIARELHDSAGHAINVILVQAGAARLLHEQDPAGSHRAIGTIEQVARGTIGEIDRLVRALRSGGEDSAQPADPVAVEELVEHHRASGLRIATDLAGPRGAVPRSVAWSAYRILQEALTNAARHGSGSADVAVRFGPTAVEITVTNPAQPGGPQGGGHGIVGMRERATLLGGTLEAEQARGTFRVHAHLPHAEAAR